MLPDALDEIGAMIVLSKPDPPIAASLRLRFDARRARESPSVRRSLIVQVCVAWPLYMSSHGTQEPFLRAPFFKRS